MFIGCQAVETSYSMHVEVTRLLPYHVPHPRTKHINALVCVCNVKKLHPINMEMKTRSLQCTGCLRIIQFRTCISIYARHICGITITIFFPFIIKFYIYMLRCMHECVSRFIHFISITNFISFYYI